MKTHRWLLFTLGASLLGSIVWAQDTTLRDTVRALADREYPSLFELYRHFHAHPELSLNEEKLRPDWRRNCAGRVQCTRRVADGAWSRF